MRFLGPAALAAMGFIILAPPSADAAGASCRHSPKVVAPCFTVHGELQVANGTPSLRLERMGNRRILGIVGDNGDAESPTILPPRLESVMKPPEPGPYGSVWGNFRVCPLAKSRPGRMQFVCIDQATHVVLAKDQPWP